MAISLRGVQVPHRKHTKDTHVEYMTEVKSVTIPMSMHIGKPANDYLRTWEGPCYLDSI